MNLKTLHKTMLTALLLVTTVISGMGQAAIYSTGFESADGFTAGTAYNNTTIKLDGTAPNQWGTYYGTASITSPLSGLMSMQMRWYTTAPTLLGYTFTNFDLANASKVVFNASSTNNLNVVVSYSIDGGATYVGAQTFTLTATKAEYSYNISITGEYPNVRLKFQLAYTTAPTATSRVYIDDVAVYPVDTQAPTLSSFTPADNATDVAADATLGMTFNENIVKGTGNITIKKVSDDSAVETIDVTTGAVVVAGATATITPSVALTKGVEYYVTVDATCFKDASANAYAGISDKTAWTFTIIAAKTGKAITAFSFAEQTGAATIGDGTIAIEVASSATVNNLIATFTVSDGANIKVGAVDQVSATTPNDFTSPVTYTVTAEDGSNKDWVVTVNKAVTLSDATDITGFTLAEQTANATIDAVNHTIAIEVGAATDITTLVPTITLSVGATVNPLSGTTQNFTSPVVYTVTAEDGTTTQTWTVTVTLASTIANTTTLAEKYYAGDNLTVTWTSANLTNVKVEWFDGTTWSDLAASVPATDGQYVIAIPAASKYGTAYKFRISDAAKTTVKAESNAITIIAVANTLAAVKTATVGDIVKYTGKATVTYARAIQGNTPYTQKYIQDETAAILIYDNSGIPGFITDTYAIGEGISNIEGKIDSYKNLIEFVPQATTGEKVTGNPTITPEVRTIVSITSADQCKLVKIENLTISATGNFATGTNYDVAGVANTVFAFRTAFAEADYIGTAIPTTPINVVCLVGQYNDVMQVTPRNLADITTVTSINDDDAVSTKAFPNPFSTDFKINAGKVVRNVVVSNMLGQKVMERTYNEIEIEVPASDLRTGVYFVTVKFEDGTTSTLRMVKK